ncbi:glycosyltransferase [Vagococcus lutrae]|uniref:glycosyltransferase n=1 Tax=Vagococcus lutrae TaxID=81947 RepID=UPI00288DA1B1|nr:glycosyltransferase [Vagococcus lutrae]MDT2817397.1 glycosyltransferase [Vagococcus lutrae]
MRILHIVSSIGRDSGVMKFIMNYMPSMKKHNIHFDFLYWSEGTNSYCEEILDNNGELFRISKPNPSLESIRELSLFFKEYSNRYDAVHLHEAYLNLVIKFFMKKNDLNKLITHAHTTKYSDNKSSALRNKILCSTINITSDKKIACSKEAGKFYFGRSFEKQGQIVRNAIINNINKNQKNNIRNIYSLNNKTVYIHIGRFNAQKNHVFLIDVFYEIVKKDPNAVLLLIGEGPLKDNINKKVKDLKIKDKVIFLGLQKNVNDFLTISDAMIFPSIYEGLGIVMIEAQYVGLPIVCSEHIPNEAIINSNVFQISLNKSPEKWAEVIEEIKGKRASKEDYIELDRLYNISNNINGLLSIYKD